MKGKTVYVPRSVFDFSDADVPSAGPPQASSEVIFNELSEITQEHIIKCIAEGYRQGEIVEDDENSKAGSIEDCDETVYEPCTENET
jgi:hypothetical protein